PDRLPDAASRIVAVVSGRRQREYDDQRGVADGFVEVSDLQPERSFHAARDQRVQIHDPVQLPCQAQSPDLLSRYERRKPRHSVDLVPTTSATVTRPAEQQGGGL